MTAHEILKETARLRGEDPDTDTTLLTEYNAVALIGMNEGYRHICERYICPTAWEEVTLDANKQFDTTDLTNSARRIIAITRYEDYTEDANWLPDTTRYDWSPVNYNTFVVPEAEASATVNVQYEILPTDLVNPYPVAVEGHAAGEGATSPTYLPTAYHRALCYMAQSKLCAKDNQKNDARFWEAQFYAALETISNISPQTDIVNVYSI
jgi:hypothetical protein